MKKSVIAVALLALCAVSTARAQGFGLLGGWAYGAVPNTNATGAGAYTANNGFSAGLSLETGGVFGLGINGLYSQRGFTNTVAGFSQKLSYIDVPVYVKLQILNPIFVPFAFAGGQASFELNCDAGGTTCPSGRDKTTFDAVAGFGVRFPMIANLSVQGRYIYALKDLNYGTINNQSNYRQRSFALLLGIGF
jgi:hypothetical protein